jgi:hypothetical protein
MGLSPAESNREQAFERRVQVAVQVEVASPGVVVEQPAVELDEQPERLVDDVAEDRPRADALTCRCARGSPCARSTSAMKSCSRSEQDPAATSPSTA